MDKPPSYFGNTQYGVPVCTHTLPDFDTWEIPGYSFHTFIKLLSLPYSLSLSLSLFLFCLITILPYVTNNKTPVRFLFSSPVSSVAMNRNIKDRKRNYFCEGYYFFHLVYESISVLIFLQTFCRCP